eukprot:gene4892-biopygen6624
MERHSIIANVELPYSNWIRFIPGFQSPVSHFGIQFQLGAATPQLRDVEHAARVADAPPRAVAVRLQRREPRRLLLWGRRPVRRLPPADERAALRHDAQGPKSTCNRRGRRCGRSGGAWEGVEGAEEVRGTCEEGTGKIREGCGGGAGKVRRMCEGGALLCHGQRTCLWQRPCTRERVPGRRLNPVNHLQQMGGSSWLNHL